MRFRRTILTVTEESVWLDPVPDDIDKYDGVDLDELVTDLINTQHPHVDEEVLDVKDSTAWEVEG